MNKERAIQILVKVAKQTLKKEIPTGISKLLISDEQSENDNSHTRSN